MKSLDAILESAVSEARTPGVVVSVATRGGVVYENAAGVRALGQPAPMTTDSVFRAFSMTKAVGAVAAAKAVEMGLLTLDTPVEEVLPEWKEVKLLEGFDSAGKPILRAPKVKATIRHLATHTSGLVYEFWNADMPKYMEATGAPTILSGLKASLLSYPLQFEPGTKWDYGIGIDWLGQAVEAVSGMRIDAFCKAHVFDPLGMGDTRFEVEPHMAPRLVGAHMHTAEGWGPYDIAPPPNPEVYGMGHALYTTGPDYLRFIRMLMQNGSLDGEIVLKPEIAAMVTANQIGDLSVGKMTTVAPPLSADVDFFPEQENKFSLACLMNTKDIPGKRRAGSQSWAGVLNTHYWFDPAAGVSCVIMLQHLPFVDPNCLAIYDAVERAVYEELG
ncbi:MAG: serine hydrolase domain-containing protein [Pikeienuella sp.]|uniref:serine hydrolase domain-containing protein n=1 Tax=Pikeienuella sp. TaxID=2831957 RepID=UPI00391B82F2